MECLALLSTLGGEKYASIENLRTGGSRCTQDSKWRLGAVGYTPLKSFPKSILAGQSCQDERICMNAKVCSRSSWQDWSNVLVGSAAKYLRLPSIVLILSHPLQVQVRQLLIRRTFISTFQSPEIEV